MQWQSKWLIIANVRAINLANYKIQLQSQRQWLSCQSFVKFQMTTDTRVGLDPESSMVCVATRQGTLRSPGWMAQIRHKTGPITTGPWWLTATSTQRRCTPCLCWATYLYQRRLSVLARAIWKVWLAGWTRVLSMPKGCFSSWAMEEMNMIDLLLRIIVEDTLCMRW